MTDAPHRTRLAPSPTGALHLGNARTFIVNWRLARQNGWRIVLRIEDIDGPRIKRGADRLAIDDLRWLGIDWDEPPVYQSQRAAVYDDVDVLVFATVPLGLLFLYSFYRVDFVAIVKEPSLANYAAVLGSATYRGLMLKAIGYGLAVAAITVPLRSIMTFPGFRS